MDTQPTATKAKYAPPDYIIETVTDAPGIRATAAAMIPRSFNVLYLVVGILLIVMSILLMLAYGFRVIYLLYLLVGVFALVFRQLLPRITAKKQISVLLETYNIDSIAARLIFWPEGMVVENRITGGSVNLRYQVISQICRCGDYLLLRTKAKQVVILRAADFADKPEFIPYLLNKCPDASRRGL